MVKTISSLRRNTNWVNLNELFYALSFTFLPKSVEMRTETLPNFPKCPKTLPSLFYFRSRRQIKEKMLRNIALKVIFDIEVFHFGWEKNWVSWIFCASIYATTNLPPKVLLMKPELICKTCANFLSLFGLERKKNFER